MVGAPLSRWTMSYFAVALLALVAAEAMMAAGFGFPNAALQAPETLVLVHVVTIGWLSLLLSGALLQFVPVLVAQPLYSNALPLPTLLSLMAGLAALILGFLQIDGDVGATIPFLAFGAGLLSLGFSLLLWNLARTFLASRAWSLPARFVVVGLVSVAATATLGTIFALVLGGLATYEPFVAVASMGLPIHVIAGLGGWLTMTAIGVSYRLLAMFMLAPEQERTSTKVALYLGTAALAVAVVAGVAAILVGGDLAPMLLAAGAAGLAALMLYGGDVLYLYRARRRRNIELNSRMASFAFASLAAAAALIVALLAAGHLADHVGAVVFLVGFGWLSGLGLAQIYKIVAFLTWLECYGPILGKAQTPRVQDLVAERRAAKWFLLHFLAVWIGTAALLASNSSVFQATSAVMLVATAGIIVELVRVRRLGDVDTAMRFPTGACRPGLLLARSPQ